MPSSYTTSLKLTLPQTGDLVGSWGNVVNSGVTSLVDQAVAGSVTVTMSADSNYTLTSTDGVSDEARNMFINVGGGPHSATRNVICPSLSKLYVVTNNTSGGRAILFKTAGGSGVTILNGLRVTVYCDGTNVHSLSSWGTSGTQESYGNTVITGDSATFRAVNTDTTLSSSSRLTLTNPAGVNRSTSVFHKNAGTTNVFGIESLDSAGAFSQTLALYTYATDTWSFSTDNIERFTIDAVGNTASNINGGVLTVGGTSALATDTHSFYASGLSPLTLRHNGNASGRFWYVGPDSASAFLVYNNATTGMFMSYGGTSWTSSSDERLKTDLVPIEDAAAKVSTLRAVTGRFKTDEEGTSRAFLIAQDVQQVLPEAITVQANEEGTLGLAYTDVIPLLVAAIKEQQVAIESLTARIAALEPNA